MAIRLLATVLGVYGGLLGALHGYYEIVQGNQRPTGLVFNALGDCEPETVAHACYPALTVIPNLALTGGVTLAVGLFSAGFAAVGIGRRHSPQVLFGLAMLLMLVGGGFFPPTYLVLGGALSAYLLRPNKPPMPAWSHPLAHLWPAIFIVFWSWIAVRIIFSAALNDTLLAIGPLLVPLEFLSVAAMALSAAAHDD